MFRVTPRTVRLLVAVPTLFATTILATTGAPRALVASP